MTARFPLWVTFALSLVLTVPVALLINEFDLGGFPAALLCMAALALVWWITKPPEAFGLPREPRPARHRRRRR